MAYQQWQQQPYPSYQQYTSWTSQPPPFNLRNGFQAVPQHEDIPLSTQAAPIKPPKTSVQADEVGEDDPMDGSTPLYRRKTTKQRYFGGLNLTLRAFAVLTALVLIINVAIFLWARNKFGIWRGYGILQQGSCGDSKMLGIWLHLAINITGTAVYMGSNAFMQAYLGPSREEVDKAHQKRRWLHIGLLSLRNIRGISFWKSLVVILLGLSSIPFHLLYNSLVFTSLSANEYYLTIVAGDFLTGQSWNTSAFTEDENNRFTAVQHNQSGFDRLENTECISQYAVELQSEYRNLFLISSQENDTTPILYSEADPYYSHSEFYYWVFWMCSLDGGGGPSEACDTNEVLQNASNWTVYGHPVEYCLAERVESVCAVKFSFDIAITVIICSLVKLLCMAIILVTIDASKILTSVGDGIASFITNEDMATHGICLADRKHLYRYWRQQNFAQPYHPSRGRWWRAASLKRWIFFTLLVGFSLCVIILLQYLGISLIKMRKLNPYKLGFGAIHGAAVAFADNIESTVLAALLANIPQLFLSVLILLFNGLMTSMFVAADFAQYAAKGEFLMVSSPAGKQRGTWLLGLPWKVGVFSLTIQTLLHWFVSQSIFALEINILSPDGTPDVDPSFWKGSVTSNCGFSPAAIWASMVALVVFTCTTYGFGLRSFKNGSPPIVSTCSASISASCHPGQFRDEKTVYEKVRWGAVRHSPFDGVGHTSIVPEEAWTSGYVDGARPGLYYS